MQFMLGALAKLGATVVTYPLLVVKVNFVSLYAFMFVKQCIVNYTINCRKGHFMLTWQSGL